MSESLTRTDLTTALDTQTEVIKRGLNDRFDHYEKRQDAFHCEMAQGFAQVIENVNDHMDKRLDRLEKLLTMEQRVELVERRTRKLAELAGHPELATANF